MSSKQFHLNWNSYKNNICNGFSRLQQQEEFVDMTLAAEGHLVKVHKNLVALASPYLKQMLQSIPCQHPVIFLNNISHQVLCYILEYIYTGEVRISNDILAPFIDACKMLHISGAESIVPPLLEKTIRREEPHLDKRSDNFAAHITVNTENYNLEVQRFENIINENRQLDPNLNQSPPLATNIEEFIKIDKVPVELIKNKQHLKMPINTDISLLTAEKNIIDLSNTLNDMPTLSSVDVNASASQSSETRLLPNNQNIESTTELAISPRYSSSNRGALELILNRYIYHCHHQSCRGKKRRWRCIDYRRQHCPAIIDTEGEVIVSRRGLHHHPYHDGKIFKKMQQNKVFTSIPIAAGSSDTQEPNKNNSDNDCEEDMKT